MRRSTAASNSLRLYRWVSLLLQPALWLWLKYRQRQGKEDAARFRERFGHASLPRPPGALLWMHAASVGESLSVLPLLAQLRQRHPGVAICLTTGTVSSAKLIATRLPDGVVHQFLPVDSLLPVRRFLRHWKPRLAVFVESELWPNLLLETEKLGCPLVLINARMSERSFRQWQQFPVFARAMLQAARLVLAQGERDSAHFKRLGAPDVRITGSIKYDAPPLEADAAALDGLRQQIGSRPCWVAASTHEGEELMVAEAQAAGRLILPEMLTILVPRHATRGDMLAQQLRAKGITLAQRSKQEPITRQTDIYLADSMGEMGLWYRLGQVVLMGGSLVPHGGQNPLEPARLGCALLSGPHMFNFEEITRDLLQAGALHQVQDVAGLAKEVTRLLRDETTRAPLAAAAVQSAAAKTGAIAQVMEALRPWLSEMEPV